MLMMDEQDDCEDTNDFHKPRDARSDVFRRGLNALPLIHRFFCEMSPWSDEATRSMFSTLSARRCVSHAARATRRGHAPS